MERSDTQGHHRAPCPQTTLPRRAFAGGPADGEVPHPQRVGLDRPRAPAPRPVLDVGDPLDLCLAVYLRLDGLRRYELAVDPDRLGALVPASHEHRSGLD